MTLVKVRIGKTSISVPWHIGARVMIALVTLLVSGCSAPYRGQFNRPGAATTGKDNASSERLLKQSSNNPSQLAAVVITPSVVLSVNSKAELAISGMPSSLSKSRESKKAAELTKFSAQPVIAATFDNSGTRLALVLKNSIEVWQRDDSGSLTSWDIVAEWAGQVPLVQSLAFSPKDASLLVGGADGHIYLWRYRSPNYHAAEKFLRGGRRDLIQRYVGHSSPVKSLVFHPSGYTFFSGDEQGVLSSWRRYDDDAYRGGLDNTAFGIRYQQESARRASPARVSTDPIAAVRVTENGEWLAIFSEAGRVELWQTRGMTQVLGWDMASGYVFDGVFGLLGQGNKSEGSVLDGEFEFRVGVLGRLGAVQTFDLHLTRSVEGWQSETVELGDGSLEGVTALAMVGSGSDGSPRVCGVIPGKGCFAID
jgi:WD40 repeat protein